MGRFDSHTPGRHRLLPLLALAAMAVLLALAGVAVARYVLQQQEKGLASAADFYFTSDYLKESGEKASYCIDPATENLSIELSNSVDSRRFAANDISYSVYVDVDGAKVASGTLQGGRQSIEVLTVDVPQNKESFTVTARSESPYAEELSATFVLASGNQYKVEDASGNAAAVLTITCADNSKSVSILLPRDVVPDATDSRVTPTDTGCTFDPGGSGVFSLVLLKTDKTIDLARGDTPFTSEIDLRGSSAAR